MPRAFHAESAGTGTTRRPTSRRGGRPYHLRSRTMPGALAQLKNVVDGLQPRFAQAATPLADVVDELLANNHLPAEHRPRLHSTNPPARMNKEIKRRSNAVGIFQNPPALRRLVGPILMEQDDAWALPDRRYFSTESMRQLPPPRPSTTAQELPTAIAQKDDAWTLWKTEERSFQGVLRAPSAAAPSNGNSGTARFSTT